MIEESEEGPVVKFNFYRVVHRFSTIASAVVTAAGAVLSWYIAQPPMVQENFPHWVLSISSMITLLGVVIIPLSTSYLQTDPKKKKE